MSPSTLRPSMRNAFKSSFYIEEMSPSTLRPSMRNAFKSSFYIEDEYEFAHVKVDFDTHKNPIKLTTIVQALSNATHYRDALGVRRPLLIYDEMVFTTGRGHHLRLWLSAAYGVTVGLPATTILRIQAACGDDPVRQRFNAIRVKRGESGWNVLWRQKWKNGSLISKEILDEPLTETLREMLEPVKAAARAWHLKAAGRS